MLKEKLRSLRKEMGLSQAELALKLGIQSTRYGFYENGTRNPKSDFFELYKNVFGIDLLATNEDNINIVAEDSVSYTKKVAYNLKDEIKQIKSSLSEILEFQRAIMINIDTGLEPLLSDLGKRIGVDNLPSKVRSSAALKLAKVLEMGI